MGSTTHDPARPWRAEPGGFVGSILASPLLLLIATFIGYGTVRLIAVSLQGRGVENYSSILSQPSTRRVIYVTLGYSLGVAVGTVLLGSVVAWALCAARSPVGRFVMWTAVFVPFLMGTIVKNYAFALLLGRRGVVNSLLQQLRIIDQPLDLLYTQFAVFLGMFYTMLPFAILPLFATMRTIQPDLLLAAQSMGASRVKAITSILVPLAAPGITSTFGLVFILSSGFYITPVLLGGPRSPFIASLINMRMFDFFDLPGAAALGVILLVVLSVVLLVLAKLVGTDRIRRTLG